MPFDTIRGWLGLTSTRDDDAGDQAPLRRLVDTLDHMEPGKARQLARFAYLLGRIAHADQQVTDDETRTMETLVQQEGGLSADQAIVVVGLAKATSLMFGGTADFQVAQEFASAATYDEKLGLLRCLFNLAAADATIAITEESELHRIATHFKILPQDLTALRVTYAVALPGLSAKPR